MTDRRCLWCGKSLDGKRKDAKFCTAAHRSICWASARRKNARMMQLKELESGEVIRLQAVYANSPEAARMIRTIAADHGLAPARQALQACILLLTSPPPS